jgi:hypothetical protein
VSFEISLEEAGGTTTSTFVHHLADRTMAGDFGPGWEFYLDLLVDSREGRPFHKLAEYYPSQKQYFLELAAGRLRRTTPRSIEHAQREANCVRKQAGQYVDSPTLEWHLWANDCRPIAEASIVAFVAVSSRPNR